MNSFFRELKQRKVYRVALGYAVVAWLVVQVSATVIPAYHAPDWILPILITTVALGFPVALVFAWAFELKGGVIEKTPEPTGRCCCEQAPGPASRRGGFDYQRAGGRRLLDPASVAQYIDSQINHCIDRF
jgi:hypothetical protein